MRCICTLCTEWERIAIKNGLMIGLTVYRPHIRNGKRGSGYLSLMGEVDLNATNAIIMHHHIKTVLNGCRVSAQTAGLI